MRRPPARSWAFLVLGFVVGTASGVTLGLALTKPLRRLRSNPRPPDPALFLQ